MQPCSMVEWIERNAYYVLSVGDLILFQKYELVKNNRLTVLQASDVVSLNSDY